MKKVTKPLIAALLLVSSVAFAQSPSKFHLGIKAGANFNTITTDLDYYNSKSALGYGLGAMARIDINKTYIQTELFLSEKNAKYEGPEANAKTTLRQIEVPLLLGHKFINTPAFNLRGYAGGVYTNTFDEKITGAKINDAILFKNFDRDNIGYRVGVGFDILSFAVDVSYDGSFNKTNKDIGARPSTWQVSVGYFLF